MQRLNKNFRLDIEPNTASERISQELTNKKRHGQPMHKMRNWMTAGFMLEEFGHGIIEYLLAQDNQQTPDERLQALMQYINRCGLDTPEKTTVVKQKLPVQETPVVTTEIKTTEPAAAKPVKRPQGARLGS